MKYLRELCKVSHLDFGHAGQDLHQVEAFICLEPAGDKKEEKATVYLLLSASQQIK